MGSRDRSGAMGSRVDLGVHPWQNQGKIQGWDPVTDSGFCSLFMGGSWVDSSGCTKSGYRDR